MARLITIQLIESGETTRGSGKSEKDPIRRLKHWFAPDGTLLLEYDPHLDETSMVFNLIEFLEKQ